MDAASSLVWRHSARQILDHLKPALGDKACDGGRLCQRPKRVGCAPTVVNQRLSPTIDTRGLIADSMPRTIADTDAVEPAAAISYAISCRKDVICALRPQMLSWNPDVGRGFWPPNSFPIGEYALGRQLAARELKRPVKWISDLN